MNKKVAILMATYNGEKYLSKQIESILNQSFQNWELYISDDMSTDDTVKILKEYREKDNRIKDIWIHQNNHGAFSNFFNVISNVQSLNKKFDYILYADQDDIWVKNKIQLLVDFIGKKEKSNPQLPIAVYTDLELIDGNDNKINKKISEIKDMQPSNQYEVIFKGGYVWGTTLIFNSDLFNMLSIPEDISGKLPHDVYTSFYACSFGKLFYYNKPLVLYRRHGENVSHLPTKSNLIKVLKVGVTKLSDTINWDSEKIWRILYFLKYAKNSNQFTDDLNNALISGGFKGIKFLKEYNIEPSNSVYSSIVFKFVLLTKLYKQTKWYKGLF